MAERHLLLNAFDMNTVGHLCHGLWRHPRDQSAQYHLPHYWEDLALTLEKGLFDGLFLADGLGMYDVYGDGPEAALAAAIQVPRNDPMLIVPLMSRVTSHLGFGITSNVTYEPPFLFARRMSTLDHLTGGRVGWNIVTGYLNSAAHAMGKAAQLEHDHRYDRADDYLEALYKLWEGSWEEGAVVRDKQLGIFTDASKVHRVCHDGPYYKVDSMHLCEPSPQRTPVLYQAGSSGRGLEFAARHAECMFVMGPSKQFVGSTVKGIRASVANAGRRADSVRILAGINVVVGRTEKEALEKFADYRQYADPMAGLAHFSSSTGVDFAAYQLDEPIVFVKNDSSNSALEAFTRKSPEKVWTVRALLEQMSLGSRTYTLVGSAEKVADELIAWQREAGVDGFNVSRSVAPECYRDFTELVVPELQARGAFKTAYQEGTLREKLLGGVAHLDASHYGAQHRRLS
ncbi:LLM class flavin-dependent oxidoreductase [Pseudomonas helleri]|uniref:LLM class flavin-dependent oxidoreductase n=1 Tax=Pseudomonas helleri TaxID=1608996 RepID=UPI00333F7C9A